MQNQINDEMLVAYLDGELPSEQESTIEQNLHADDQLRQRVSALRASWDLLEDLPNQAPRPDLAQSTIEIVTLALERESRTWRRWLYEHRWLALGLGGLLMLAAGAAASRALTNHLTRQILANLPAIVEYRSLQYIGSVEFLEQLSQIDNLTEAAGQKAGPGVIGDGMVPLDIASRELWVESLEDVDRGRLGNNYDEYRRQTDERKNELRQITDVIYDNPSKTGKYLETIRAYSAILDKLGNKQAALLQGKNKNIDERIRVIKEQVSLEMALKYAPSAEERDAFRAWLFDMQFDEDRMYDADSQIINELLYGDPLTSFVTQHDVEDLKNRLSPTAEKLLRDLPDEAEQRLHLGLWISSAVQSTTQNDRPPNAVLDLEQRFNEQSKDRQNQLEFLPEGEVRNTLRQVAPANSPKVTPLP